jgi:hypothetical protein
LTKNNESCMALTNLYGPDDEDIYLMYGGGTLSNGNIQYQQPNVNGWFYALGVLKTTKSNPFELTNVRLDLDEPSIHPTDTNKIDYGLFDKCMFADSMIRKDNQWFLYYGAGDMYVGVALARADFGAGAATFTRSGDVLNATTLALNKAYGDDKSPRDIEIIADVRAIDGTLLGTNQTSYRIRHFSQSILGMYSRGEAVAVSVDLALVAALPTSYYVTVYLRDAVTLEVLNQPSSYAVVTPTVVSVAK